jgi:hypothetical protein
MKILILAFLLRGSISDSLPNRAELFATLRTFHAETADANADGLNVSQKYAWLHWLPSVGVTLGKPTVGFSFGQLVSNIETKAQRTAQKRQILRGANLAFRSDSFALVALIERYESAVNAIPYLTQVEAVENRKFELIKEKWKNGELVPLDWLNAQSANFASGEPLRKQREAAEILEIEIRKLAKY